MTGQMRVKEIEARLEELGEWDIWNDKATNAEIDELHYQLKLAKGKAEFDAIRTMFGDEAILGALTS